MGGRISSIGITASLVVMSASLVTGQAVISARSGMVHYVEGQVTIDDKAVEVNYSQFPEVREKQVLKTEEGRAEILLTPGVFLRVAESSSFRMVSSRLADTRIEALTGSLMIEYGEIAKDSQVTLLFKDRTITFAKSGLYRLNADTGAFRVYQGEAKIVGGDQTLVAKQAHEVMLSAPVLTAMKFDAKQDDDFYRWASRRAEYLALANISSAKSLRDSGYGYGSSMMGSGLWSWNPYFGMFTYVPFGSMYNSPFGYSFFSPYLISGFYQNYPGYYGGNSYTSGGGGGGGVGRTATRGSVNYAAPSRPTSASSGSGIARSSGGDFGGFSGGNSGGSSHGSSGGGAISSGGSSGASSVSSAGGGGSHGGSAGGHGR